MTNNQIVKEYFKEYSAVEQELEQLGRKLVIKQNKIFSPKGINYGESIGGGTKPSLVEQIYKIDEIKAQIKKLTSKRENLLEKCKDMVNNLEDIEYKKIIEMFYLEHLSIKEIANILFLGEITVKKKKNFAENILAKIILEKKENNILRYT